MSAYSGTSNGKRITAVFGLVSSPFQCAISSEGTWESPTQGRVKPFWHSRSTGMGVRGAQGFFIAHYPIVRFRGNPTWTWLWCWTYCLTCGLVQCNGLKQLGSNKISIALLLTLNPPCPYHNTRLFTYPSCTFMYSSYWPLYTDHYHCNSKQYQHILENHLVKITRPQDTMILVCLLREIPPVSRW